MIPAFDTLRSLERSKFACEIARHAWNILQSISNVANRWKPTLLWSLDDAVSWKPQETLATKMQSRTYNIFIHVICYVAALIYTLLQPFFCYTQPPSIGIQRYSSPLLVW